jgi:hypothetical protein
VGLNLKILPFIFFILVLELLVLALLVLLALLLPLLLPLVLLFSSPLLFS